MHRLVFRLPWCRDAVVIRFDRCCGGVAMQVLDVRDSSEVESASAIGADRGVAGRRLPVLSGVALVNGECDSGEVWRGETQVGLGIFASNLEQWRALVGLASTANDESSFVFAADTAQVRLPARSSLRISLDRQRLTAKALLGTIEVEREV
jgi:hypothetical protein